MTIAEKENTAPDERLLKVAIEREPLGVAKQWGYEVHRLSPRDIVDKDDYARGYRYRLSKVDPTQPYPQIVMARSEGEVATFLKRQIGDLEERAAPQEGNPTSRVHFDRADIDSAIEAAKRLKSERDLYIFATHLGYTIDNRPPPGMQAYVIVHPDGSTETIRPSVGGNPMTEKKRHYSRPYLANWQYGGYNYVEEDPTKPEELWPHGMVDYADPDEVIAIAEREGLPEVSLAGSWWEQIGYKGWGEKVSISEAKSVLAKAKEHMRAPSSSVVIPSPSPIVRQQVPEEKKGGNPMTPEEIDQVATKVAAKVLEEVSPSVLDPAGRGMLLHFTEHAIEGSGLVVNEARARATPCNCFTYKDREYCFSAGVIGMMSSKENPEQLAEYCKVGKTYEVKPGIKERFESFAGAAEEAHKKIEEIPKGERLVPWLSAMGEELEKRGIEV